MSKFFRITTLAALALGATSLAAQAQGAKQFGVLAGADFASISGDDFDPIDPGTKTGFVGGLYYAFPVGSGVAIEPEVLYAMKGASFDAIDVDLTNSYIEVPVLVKYTFNSAGGPYLLGGPAVGFSMSCNLTDGDTDAGAIHADVDGAEGRGCAVHGLSDLVFRGDVGGREQDVLAELAGERLSRRLGTVENHRPRAARHERAYRCLAETGRTAGHDRIAATEVQLIHRGSPRNARRDGARLPIGINESRCRRVLRGLRAFASDAIALIFVRDETTSRVFVDKPSRTHRLADRTAGCALFRRGLRANTFDELAAPRTGACRRLAL